MRAAPVRGDRGDVENVAIEGVVGERSLVAARLLDTQIDRGDRPALARPDDLDQVVDLVQRLPRRAITKPRRQLEVVEEERVLERAGAELDEPDAGVAERTAELGCPDLEEDRPAAAFDQALDETVDAPLVSR